MLTGSGRSRSLLSHLEVPLPVRERDVSDGPRLLYRKASTAGFGVWLCEDAAGEGGTGEFEGDLSFRMGGVVTGLGLHGVDVWLDVRLLAVAVVTGEEVDCIVESLGWLSGVIICSGVPVTSIVVE